MIMMVSIVFLIFTFFFVLEKAFPAQPLPEVSTWHLRAIFLNSMKLIVIFVADIAWDRWFSGASIFNLSENMSTVPGGLLAYVFTTFVFYWWHRWRHEFSFLWRIFHQIHHSPQRVEAAAAFYTHPNEMIVNSIIVSMLLYAVLGISLESAIISSLLSAVVDVFIHSNIKTPYWLGFFFQRPEMHRIHHQYQYHKNNYGDISCWDMIFKTYENPKESNQGCGFDNVKEQQLWKMLCCHDIHKS